MNITLQKPFSTITKKTITYNKTLTPYQHRSHRYWVDFKLACEEYMRSGKGRNVPFFEGDLNTPLAPLSTTSFKLKNGLLSAELFALEYQDVNKHQGYVKPIKKAVLPCNLLPIEELGTILCIGHSSVRQAIEISQGLKTIDSLFKEPGVRASLLCHEDIANSCDTNVIMCVHDPSYGLDLEHGDLFGSLYQAGFIKQGDLKRLFENTCRLFVHEKKIEINNFCSGNTDFSCEHLVLGPQLYRTLATIIKLFENTTLLNISFYYYDRLRCNNSPSFSVCRNFFMDLGLPNHAIEHPERYDSEWKQALQVIVSEHAKKTQEILALAKEKRSKKREISQL